MKFLTLGEKIHMFNLFAFSERITLLFQIAKLILHLSILDLTYKFCYFLFMLRMAVCVILLFL